MNILKRLFCRHDYKFVRNIDWKRSLFMCPKCGSFQYRNEIKCDGCNNFKGCVTCKDGSEWAHLSNEMTKEEATKYLHQLYPNGGHCWLDEQRIEAIGMAIKALQEEPTASDRDMAEEIIVNLKRVEQDYRIDLTRYIEWLRNKVKKGE